MGGLREGWRNGDGWEIGMEVEGWEERSDRLSASILLTESRDGRSLATGFQLVPVAYSALGHWSHGPSLCQ